MGRRKAAAVQRNLGPVEARDTLLGPDEAAAPEDGTLSSDEEDLTLLERQLQQRKRRRKRQQAAPPAELRVEVTLDGSNATDQLACLEVQLPGSGAPAVVLGQAVALTMAGGATITVQLGPGAQVRAVAAQDG